MDRESMQKLRLDRRLIRRRGWIPKAELDKALAELPDVEHKAVPLEAAAPGSRSDDAEAGEEPAG